MYGYIYETTNLINKKKYIGKHKSNFFDSNYYGSGIALKRAINKYGKENFSIRILEECNSQKELDKKETYYIELFDAVNSSKFYNNSYGGENEGWKGVNKAINEGSLYINRFKGRTHSDSSKKKISEALKGRPSPRRGTKISEKQRRAIIESNHRKKGTRLSEQGRKHISEACKGRKIKNETKHKISIACKGRKIKNETKHKISIACKGRKHITNGVENKFIKIEELDRFISNGWRLGQTNRR